ncbi:MAG TPA: hypothetical protein VF902_08775 [Coriobacteriia bacterium]
MGDDWGETEDPIPTGAAPRSHRRQSTGLSRDQRFGITLAGTAAVMLVVGLLVGVAIGRATAPRTQTPSASAEPTATAAAETPASGAPTDTSVPGTETAGAGTEPTSPEATVATYTPPAPKQLSPADGARIAATRVALKWSKVSPPNGGAVTYAFDIETYSGGKWGGLQTIRGLTAPTYSARVLANTRRWRVWAVVDGVAGPKSVWRKYRPVATVTPKPSTTTTSN